jgi:hypothetical protein
MSLILKSALDSTDCLPAPAIQGAGWETVNHAYAVLRADGTRSGPLVGRLHPSARQADTLNQAGVLGK